MTENFLGEGFQKIGINMNKNLIHYIYYCLFCKQKKIEKITIDSLKSFLKNLDHDKNSKNSEDLSEFSKDANIDFRAREKNENKLENHESNFY